MEGGKCSVSVGVDQMQGANGLEKWELLKKFDSIPSGRGQKKRDSVTNTWPWFGHSGSALSGRQLFTSIITMWRNIRTLTISSRDQRDTSKILILKEL